MSHETQPLGLDGSDAFDTSGASTLSFSQIGTREFGAESDGRTEGMHGVDELLIEGLNLTQVEAEKVFLALKNVSLKSEHESEIFQRAARIVSEQKVDGHDLDFEAAIRLAITQVTRNEVGSTIAAFH